jgi:predicted secreted protein
MFTDIRAKKIVVLAHCILNQNAKLDRCAHCPGAVREVVGVLLENDIGILQMECPEMLHLGLERETDRAANPSVASEDTRIGRRMQEPAAQAIIDRIARNTVQQICDYRKNGFAVIGILGINGSPSCGVETTWRDDAEPAGFGELTGALAERLTQLGLDVPMRGIRSRDVTHAVATVRELLPAQAPG